MKKQYHIWGDIVQGTEQWMQVRAGRPTASQADRILTAGGKPSKQAADYALELIAESCSGPSGWGGNRNTDRGLELEPEARERFSMRYDLEVKQVGFVTRHDGVIGCSPDGFVIDRNGCEVAGLEIKCPLPKTHIKYLQDDCLPDDYKPQVHWSMMVTGLPWHFFSYCPGMRPLHILVKPDGYTDLIRSAAEDFLVQYAALRNAIIDKVFEKPNNEPRF